MNSFAYLHDKADKTDRPTVTEQSAAMSEGITNKRAEKGEGERGEDSG